jgi:hypothetical protein
MSTSNSPGPASTAAPRARNVLGMWSAWVSLALPILAGLYFEFAQPMWFSPPGVVYWATFACSIISFALGGVAIGTIGRRVDWYILAPAIVGIILSLVLSYCSLAFGILSSTGPVPVWNQIFPWWQSPPRGGHF